MTFQDYSRRSNAEAVVLFEVDNLIQNTQWVNIGAGIWMVNFDASYPFVDSSLLTGFTAQNFTDVNNVYVDNQIQTKCTTLASITTTTETWYASGNDLYIHVVNNDSPLMHSVFLGQAYGFSFNSFTPVGSNTYYDGRLISVPDLGRTRDPLFFGRLSYPSANVTIINSDGEFDTFVEDNNMYGNAGRILFGYADLDISEYVTLFSGFIETVNVSDDAVTFNLTDKRKQLSRTIPVLQVEENPIEAIKAIINEAYGIQFTEGFYDTAAFNTAENYASGQTMAVSIYGEDDAVLQNVVEWIQEICNSTWGIFDTTDDGRFTFRFITAAGTPTSNIPSGDIINPKLSVNYDPSEVISSVRVGYNKDWGDNSYTYYTDDSREATVFGKYKTYNEQTFETLLAGTTAATASESLAERILDYTDAVHGIVDIEVPMRYYTVNIGDYLSVQLDRENSEMLSWRLCEVLGKTYKTSGVPFISLRLRIVADLDILVNEVGDYIVTEDGYMIALYG